MTISKENVKENIESVKTAVTEKVAKDITNAKEVLTETAENLEKLGKEAQQKVTEAVTETKVKIDTETEQLNEQTQEQVQNFKKDLVQRLDAIKVQFSTSQKDLFELTDFLKSELSLLVKELTEVGKEIREDVSQISLKHKEHLTETLKRSKDSTLDAWKKVTHKVEDVTISKN